jgi:hypothetical protein
LLFRGLIGQAAEIKFSWPSALWIKRPRLIALFARPTILIVEDESIVTDDLAGKL